MRLGLECHLHISNQIRQLLDFGGRAGILGGLVVVGRQSRPKVLSQQRVGESSLGGSLVEGATLLAQRVQSPSFAGWLKMLPHHSTPIYKSLMD